MVENQRIPLQAIWKIENLGEYKVHFGRWNGDVQPLEDWVRDETNWVKWQVYRPASNLFNRKHIFSLLSFYHERDTWLFGGVFEVLDRHPDRYDVKLLDDRHEFIGRLKILSPYRERATRVNLENHYESFDVAEILRERYTGRTFPGYDEIDISFNELEAVVVNSRPDWKQALSGVKGIYLITDVKTGKRYIGSAYGADGIWSRWTSYVDTGHGGNVELRKLVPDPTLSYCRESFRFALLEHRDSRTPDEDIVRREGFWKNLLLTRGDAGLNRN